MSSAATPLPAYASYEHMRVTSPAPWVAHMEINRPQKLNAFSRQVWLEFGAVFAQLSADKDVRAVVLSGRGDKAFTSGLDVQAASEEGLKDEEGLDAARKAWSLRWHIDEFQSSIGAVEKCEKQIRIAAANTRFAVKEVDVGLAADIGTLSRLPKIVGSMSWVKDVCLTARDFTAAEALAQGFVSQVHETKEAAVGAALKLAVFLAEKSPVAVQGTKELINYGRDHGVAESLRYTSVWNSAAVQGDDLKAALVSGLKKTKPTFAKL